MVLRSKFQPMDGTNFWTAASAVAGLGVLLVTAVYVWLTHRLAKAAENQSWESNRGRIVASIGTNQGGQLFLLEIENFGNGTAEDLKVSIDRPLFQQIGQNRSVTDAPFFKQGVRSLAPNRAIKFSLGVSSRWLNTETDRSIHPVTFDVTVQYSTLGKTVCDVFPIDIERQFSFSAVDKDYSEEFARTFPDKFERFSREIQRSLRNLEGDGPDTSIRRRSWPDWFSRKVEQAKRYRSF